MDDAERKVTDTSSSVDFENADGVLTGRHKCSLLRQRGSTLRIVTTAVVATWLLGATTLVANDARAETVRVVLTSTLVPEKVVELIAPRQYVSSRHAGELSTGSLNTDSLYLVFRYSPQSANPVSAASPRDFVVGAPGLTHVFLNIPYRPASADIGQWYLNTFIRDAKRALTYRDPEQIAAGVLMYDFGGTRREMVITYKDADSKTVAVRCRVRTCRGYKTWNSVVHVSYWYEHTEHERISVEHPREVDTFVRRLLANTPKTNHRSE